MDDNSIENNSTIHLERKDVVIIGMYPKEVLKEMRHCGDLFRKWTISNRAVLPFIRTYSLLEWMSCIE